MKRLVALPAWASWLIVTVLLAACTVWCLAVPPAKGFADENLARIVVFHLPFAFAATVFMVWSSYLSLRTLLTRSLEWDARAAAAMLVTMLMSLLTMLTGIVFSKTQWGAWWHGDPRQFSFLLVLLVVAAYFALRHAFTDEERRATHSAAYVVASILPNLFLVFVLPRVMFSFHPDVVGSGGGFDRAYWSAILGVFAVVALLCTWLYQCRVTAWQLERRSLEAADGELDADRGAAAPTGVVRPAATSDAGNSEGEAG